MLNATLTSEMSPLGMRSPVIATTCTAIHASVIAAPATALHTGKPTRGLTRATRSANGKSPRCASA